MADANRRVSRLWSVTAAFALALGVIAGVVAARHQIEATRPIGEGELFAVEAARAIVALDSPSTDLDTAVRALRNQLTIEAVAVVDEQGVFVASSSPTLLGHTLASGFLRGAAGEFRAVTAAPGVPITVDGIVEWDADDILYQVAQPLSGDRAAVLMYDMAELTARRANPSGIRPETLQIGAVGLALIVVAIVLMAGRAGARRRLATALHETERIAQRAEELAQVNTTLSEARAQAEAALSLAEEKIRIRSEFVLMINHELRTPLTGVVTGAELLMHDPTMPVAERTALLADKVREGERLRSLISRMLTVARVENRGLGYTLRDVPVVDVMASLHSSHPSLGVEDQGTNATIQTDPDGLVALIASLVDNATTHGASSVRLRLVDSLPFAPVAEVGTRPDRPAYLLVEDDGPGIERGFLPRLFEKFEKSSPSSGTGLGLYLARMMIEAMHGSISVNTGPGGTTMAIAVGLVAQPEEARR